MLRSKSRPRHGGMSRTYRDRAGPLRPRSDHLANNDDPRAAHAANSDARRPASSTADTPRPYSRRGRRRVPVLPKGLTRTRNRRARRSGIYTASERSRVDANGRRSMNDTAAERSSFEKHALEPQRAVQPETPRKLDTSTGHDHSAWDKDGSGWDSPFTSGSDDSDSYSEIIVITMF